MNEATINNETAPAVKSRFYSRDDIRLTIDDDDKVTIINFYGFPSGCGQLEKRDVFDGKIWKRTYRIATKSLASRLILGDTCDSEEEAAYSAIEKIKRELKSKLASQDLFRSVKQVVFSKGTTIVFWFGGAKTIVKTSKKDKRKASHETGVKCAIVKHLLPEHQWNHLRKQKGFYDIVDYIIWEKMGNYADKCVAAIVAMGKEQA